MKPAKKDPRLAAVIGWPVKHSLSPALHSYWLAKHKIPGAYVALPVEPCHFGASVHALMNMGFAGANVTIPHKEAAYALCARLDEDALATGAVNTLAFKNGEIHGRNTDVAGFAANLNAALGKKASGPAVILGAGGAARAVLRALDKRGHKDIRILNRTRSRAESLAAMKGLKAKVSVREWGDWQAAFEGATLLVNASSLGMVGKEKFSDILPSLPKKASVADIVYNPLLTDFLKLAKKRGHKTVDGLGMLMHQAVPAFAAWFGVTPKVTPELRKHLEKVLRG